jgi:hypothetical protein
VNLKCAESKWALPARYRCFRPNDITSNPDTVPLHRGISIWSTSLVRQVQSFNGVHLRVRFTTKLSQLLRRCPPCGFSLQGNTSDIVGYSRSDRARFEKLLEDHERGIFLAIRTNNDRVPAVLPSRALPRTNLPTASRRLAHDFTYVGYNRRQDRRVIETFWAAESSALINVV